MPLHADHDGREQDADRELVSLVRASAGTSIAFVVAVWGLGASAVPTEAGDWQLVLVHLRVPLLVPPAAALVLTGLAVGCAAAARGRGDGRARWYRGAGLLLGYVALLGVFFEVVLLLVVLVVLGFSAASR